MNKNKIAGQYRQGDVLVEQINQLPAGAKKDEGRRLPGRIVLAAGEATGHHHTVDADAADWWKLDMQTEGLKTKRKTSLTHQEHAAITLPKGKYRVVRQREYSPSAIRNVAD